MFLKVISVFELLKVFSGLKFNSLVLMNVKCPRQVLFGGLEISRTPFLDTANQCQFANDIGSLFTKYWLKNHLNKNVAALNFTNLKNLQNTIFIYKINNSKS